MQAHWEITENGETKKLPFLFAPFDGSLERRVAQYVAPDLQLEFPNDSTAWTLGSSFGDAFDAATLTKQEENVKKYDKAPYPFMSGRRFVEYQPAPPPRLNVLYFPTVASRFAHILAIFEDERVKVGTKVRLKTDVPIIKNAPFFFGIQEQKYLDLYVVTSRPIDLKEGTGWNPPKSPRLCLLVDWRYFMRGAQFEAIYPAQDYPFGSGKKIVSVSNVGGTASCGQENVLQACFWKVFQSGFFTVEDWTRATTAPGKFRAGTTPGTIPVGWSFFGTTPSGKEARAYFADGAPLLPILDAALATYGARLYRGEGTPGGALLIYEKDGERKYFKPPALREAAEEQEEETPPLDLTGAVPFSRYPARILFPKHVLTDDETTEAGELTDYATTYDANWDAYFPDEDQPESAETLTPIHDKTTDETVGAFFAPKYWEFRKGDYGGGYIKQWETIAPSTENATSKCAPVVLTRYFATIDANGKVRNAQGVRAAARYLNAVVETLATLPESYALFLGARDRFDDVVCRLEDAAIERPQNFSAFVPSPFFVPLFGGAPEPVERTETPPVEYFVTTTSPSSVSTTTTTTSDGENILTKTYSIKARVWFEAYEKTTETGGDDVVKWRPAKIGNYLVFQRGVSSIQFNNKDFSVEQNPTSTLGRYEDGVYVLVWRGVQTPTVINNQNATGYFKALQAASPLSLSLSDSTATLSFGGAAFRAIINDDPLRGAPVVTNVGLTINDTAGGGIAVVTSVECSDGSFVETTRYLHLTWTTRYVHVELIQQ